MNPSNPNDLNDEQQTRLSDEFFNKYVGTIEKHEYDRKFYENLVDEYDAEEERDNNTFNYDDYVCCDRSVKGKKCCCDQDLCQSDDDYDDYDDINDYNGGRDGGFS